MHPASAQVHTMAGLRGLGLSSELWKGKLPGSPVAVVFFSRHFTPKTSVAVTEKSDPPSDPLKMVGRCPK